MSIPQRAYIYLAAFVAFAVLLQGAYGLATDVARAAAWFRPGGDALATWIAMIIVGLPVWLVHDLLLRRAVIKYPEEAGSALRKLYIHGALALSTLYIFFGSILIIQEIAGGVTGLEHIGGVLVAAGLWYYLWRREDLEGQPSSRAQTVKRWRIYGLSVIFLTLAVAATYWIIFAIAYYAYELATGASDTLLGPEDIGNPLRTAAAWALVGTTAWAIQWRAVATRDEESVLRQVYLYGFTFVGGAALALWGATATIYVVIAQLVGADDTTTAVAYFRQFILPVVGLLIGLALLAYHWSIIRRDAARRAPLRHSRESGNLEPGMQPTPVTPPTATPATPSLIPATPLRHSRESGNLEPGMQPTPVTPPTSDPASPTVIPSAGEESPQLSNTFKYIMSAVGLIALVPGIMVLVMTILFLLTEGDVLAPANGDAEALAVALTMIIVGAPLWFAFWWRVVRADPHALIRRIYLYVALIALGGTWLFTLIALLAAVLTEILGQGSGFLDDALILGLSILLPAATFFAYHTLVLREDSRRAPSPVPATPTPESESPTPDPESPAKAGAHAAYHTIPAPPYILPDWKPPRP